jgi:hypothetical protein
MKNNLRIICAIFLFPLGAICQNAIPNAGFETWINQGSYEDPKDWGTLNQQTSQLGIKTVTKATGADAYSGSYAIKLQTKYIGFPINQTAPGIAATGTINAQTQGIDGGVAYNLRPDSIVGWYKYTPVGTDTASVEVTFSKWNSSTNQRDEVGKAVFSKNTAVNNYTRFAKEINYSLSINPDTMVVILLSSWTGATQNNQNSTFIVDDLDLVFANPPLTGAVTSTNLNCNGVCTGQASVSASGGTSPYSYSWSNNQTTSSVSSLCAGTYTVTVTDMNGSTIISTANITEPSAITANTTATNASCGNNNGSATVSASGGTSPYTYSWSNSQSTATITGLSAGTYTVTVTDNKGCAKTATATVSSNGGATVTATSTNTSCFGGSNGSASVSASGGSTPYSYSWSNGQTTSVISGLPAGVYNVTVTDGASCSSMASVTVNQPTAITATTTSTSANCNTSNGTATVTANGGTPGYTYLWSTSPAQTAQTANNLSAGTYTVTVTDANNCSITATVVVNGSGGANITANSTNVSCNGGTNGSVTVSASGGTTPYSYNWSSGQTTSSVSGLPAGTYSITVTDGNGCPSVASVTVTNPAAINITTTTTNASGSTASDGTATASVTGGTPPYSYMWNNGQTNATATGLAPGTYTVNITDANGCQMSSTATVSFNVGIDQSALLQNIYYYPNPVENFITIVAKDNNTGLTVLLFDITGKQVFNKQYNDNIITIDLSNFNNGVYLYRFIASDSIKNGKIIKQ